MSSNDTLYIILRDNLDQVMDAAGNLDVPDSILDHMIISLAETEGEEWVYSNVIDDDEGYIRYGIKWALTGEHAYADMQRVRGQYLLRAEARRIAAEFEDDLRALWRDTMTPDELHTMIGQGDDDYGDDCRERARDMQAELGRLG